MKRLTLNTAIVVMHLALAGCGARVDQRLSQIEQRQLELDIRVAVDERRARHPTSFYVAFAADP